MAAIYSGHKCEGLCEWRNLALCHTAHLSILETRQSAALTLQEEGDSSERSQEHFHGAGKARKGEETRSSNGGTMEFQGKVPLHGKQW